MKNKSTFIFLIFVVGLGAYTAWDLQSDKKVEEQKAQDSILIPFKAEQVQTFSIISKSQKITLDKTVDGWKLTSPLQDWADNAATDEFILQLTKQKSISAIANRASDISVYGLDSPSGEISVTHQNQQNITLEVGSQKTVEQNSYLRKKDNPQVLVAAPEWTSWIQKTTSEFRDRRIFRGKMNAILEIEIKNAKGGLRLEKKDNQWILSGHPEVHQDQSRIREMLAQISLTKAEEIVAEKNISVAQQIKYGLKTPQVQVFFKLEDKKWQASFVQNKDKSIYALISDPVFLMRLDETLFDHLKFLKKSSFKDRKEIFDFKKELAVKIDFQTALKKQTFRLKNSKWVLESKEADRPVSEDKVMSFLTSLTKLGLIDFVDAASSFKPQNKIQVKDAQDKMIFEFAWVDFQKIKIDETSKNVALGKTSVGPDLFYIEQNEIDLLKLSELIPTK